MSGQSLKKWSRISNLFEALSGTEEIPTLEVPAPRATREESFPALPAASEEVSGGSGAAGSSAAAGMGGLPTTREFVAACLAGAAPAGEVAKPVMAKPVVAARSRGRTPDKKVVFGGKAAVKSGSRASSVGGRVSRQSMGGRGGIVNVDSSVESVASEEGVLTVPVGSKAKINSRTDLTFEGKQPRPDRFSFPKYTQIPAPARGDDHPLDTPAPKYYTYVADEVRVRGCDFTVRGRGTRFSNLDPVFRQFQFCIRHSANSSGQERPRRRWTFPSWKRP
jgi:hypothetical protein